MIAKEFYFVFTPDVRIAHPVMRFLKGGFKHVFVMFQTGDRVGFINTDDSEISVEFLEGSWDAEYCARTFIEQLNWSIVKWQNTNVVKKPKIRHTGNWIPSCVSVSKMFGGINSFAVTPYGLYKYLLKTGGSKLSHKITDITNVPEFVKAQKIKYSLVNSIGEK